MIRIRFHGRGGHGVKTAARIVGTAAFLAGYQVQDSPVYGAERRGAAVAAFARIDKSPILERGLIESPDLIVIADETLLDDRTAAVLAGQESASAVFVNVGREASLAAKYKFKPPLFTFDITTLTRQALGTGSALSAGLGAVAARLTGLITAEQMADAVREELHQLHAADDVIEKNVNIAQAAFAALPAVQFSTAVPQAAGRMQAVGYDHAVVGTASIVAPGNAMQRNTGTWRVERPEIAVPIHERSTGIARIDRRIGLDRLVYHGPVRFAHRAGQSPPP